MTASHSTMGFAAFLALSLASSHAKALSFERVSVPADVKERFVACPMSEKPLTGKLLGKERRWRTASEIGFKTPAWPTAVKAGMTALPLDKDVYATVIDMRRVKGGEHAFLYLSNGTQDKLIQPWSSSKFLAAASAVRVMRAAGVGADSTVGNVHFGDYVSSMMHGFATRGAPALSNDIGTWMQNVAGRKNSNAVIKDFLKRPGETFGGAYGGLLPGSPAVFKDRLTGKTARVFHGGADATGTKLSTLTLAEGLKRLATQQDPGNPTPWAKLTESDVATILYGSPQELGGMLLGLDGYVRDALGGKKALDAATGGRWRVFGKMGAAELYVGNEQIVNAYVCLPELDGGRAFVLSVHAFGLVGKEGDKRLAKAVDAVVRGVVPTLFE